MNNFCKNHPNKVAFSFCHNCGKYYCKDCLIEGDVYYYCKKPECISALDIEKKIAQPKSTRIFATLSDRIVAVLFDFFVLFILSSILAIPFYFNNPKFVYDNLITDFGWFVLFRNPFGYFISLIYFSSTESSSKMGSFGKRWQNINVVNKELGKISFLRALLRNFIKFFALPIFIIVIIIPTEIGMYLIGFYVLIIFLGYFLPIITKYNQALHDIVSGTYVIENSQLKNYLNQQKQICSYCNEENILDIKKVIRKEYSCAYCTQVNVI